MEHDQDAINESTLSSCEATANHAHGSSAAPDDWYAIGYEAADPTLYALWGEALEAGSTPRNLR